MRPGRVVIINDRSAEIGGASNLSSLAARMLREADVPVTFFAGDEPAGMAQPQTVHVNGRPLVEQGRLSALAGGLYNRDAYRILSRWIAGHDNPSTIYHVHGWSKILSPSIFRALMPVRERVVLHAHDYFLACPNGGFINYPAASICTLDPMSMRCLSTQCDKRGYHQKVWRSTRHLLLQRFFALRSSPANIVLVHEQMRGFFKRAGVDDSRMVTIRNPVAPFLSSPTRPHTQRDFFFIGRLEPEKGFEDAARAARLAGVPLHVIGEGAGRSLLEEHYPEVMLHGWCNRAQMADRLRHARCVIVSSRVPEPFGLAALEAVGSGIPVVLPSHALLAAELAEAGAAFTFPTLGIEALAAKLRRLADDDDLVSAMSENARSCAPHLANTTQSWLSALLDLYAGILHDAIKARSPTPGGKRGGATRSTVPPGVGGKPGCDSNAFGHAASQSNEAG